MHRLEQIAATYAWFHAYGNDVQEEALATYVINRAHPNVWDANHVTGVGARTVEEIEQVLARAEQAFAHCEHRMVSIDAFTPEPFVARLALEDYGELTPILQMVLEGDLPPANGQAHWQLRPIESEQDWESLYTLSLVDHAEGKTTRGVEFDETVARGLWKGYRAKSAVSQFFIASVEGVDCAYGSAVMGPYGMGIVETVFTLPAYRKRGLATAIIGHSVQYARQRGMGPMLIGALVDQQAKQLYARLGFVPQCLTRPYLRGDGS